MLLLKILLFLTFLSYYDFTTAIGQVAMNVKDISISSKLNFNVSRVAYYSAFSYVCIPIPFTSLRSTEAKSRLLETRFSSKLLRNCCFSRVIAPIQT